MIENSMRWWKELSPIFSQLPDPHQAKWSKKRRKAFLKTLDGMLDLLIDMEEKNVPVVSKFEAPGLVGRHLFRPIEKP